MKTILVVAKLSDAKLKETLLPLATLAAVDKLLLVRRYPISGPKISCYTPPRCLRGSLLLSEVVRFCTIVYLCFIKKIDLIIGIHFVMHGIYAGVLGILLRIPYMLMIVESPEIYGQQKLFGALARRARWVSVRGHKSKTIMMKQHGMISTRVFILRDICERLDVQISTSEENLIVDIKPYDIIFVGYYSKEKRLDIFLKVIDRVRRELPHVRAAIVGHGPLYAQIHAKRKAMQLENHVDMLGYVPHIEPYLAQSKVFMMTSLTEGLPTVLLEAMAQGLPCIVPDVGDIRDVAKEGLNALVVEPLNVEAFAQACQRVLTDIVMQDSLREGVKAFLKAEAALYRNQTICGVWEKVLTQTKVSKR